MKVLRLISGLDPQSGGPPVSAVNSAIAAARSGVYTHFAFAAERPDDARNFPGARRLAAEGIAISIHPLPKLMTRQAARVGFSPALGRFIAREIERFDVVHVHGPWTYPALVATRLARRAGRPVAMTPHEALTDYDMSHARLPGFRTLKGLMKSYYVHSVSAVVLSSTLELRDSAVEPLPAEWIVVPHPVFDERISEPAAPVTAGGGFTVGMLGRIHKKKHIERAIEALQGLDHVTLSIAGTGDADLIAALRRRAAELGVADRVRWLGFLDGRDKDAFLASLDLLIVPSDYECFGMAAAEAMMLGRPVLVSPSVGVADVVEKYRAGFVVRPEAASIRGALVRATADRAGLVAMQARARFAARDSFSYAAHGKALSALYTRIARAPAA